MVQWDVKNEKFSQPSLKDFLMDIQEASAGFNTTSVFSARSSLGPLTLEASPGNR